MNTTSISNLKINPSSIIAQATDYPVAVENRNKIQAYLIGKDLYEKMISFIEDLLDQKTAKKTIPGMGKDFEKVAKELGI